jgi:hypothetical protein
VKVGDCPVADIVYKLDVLAKVFGVAFIAVHKDAE